jgi:hypothetical protein
MTDKDGLLNAKLGKRLADEIGLRRRRPDGLAGSITTAKAGAVKRYDAMFLGNQIERPQSPKRLLARLSLLAAWNWPRG